MKSILVELEMLKAFALGVFITYQIMKYKYKKPVCYEIKRI
jgi:hypothetical protein